MKRNPSIYFLSISLSIYLCMYARMYVSIFQSMYVYIYLSIHVCMYVCMCIHMCVRKYNNLYRSTFGCIYDVRVCVGCFKIPHLIDGPELFVSGLTNKYQIDMIAKKREIESQRV